MLRKLTTTVVVIVAGSLALASTALARMTAEVGSGATSSPTTGGGFPWNDVAIGVVLAAAVVASLAGVALYGRTRRRSAALHA
ncbi:MAG TPA: hypothetical protein VFU56_06890 [Gaiellaceae bacterium]|nr:hypothetical protein [Gaiellaceae bacterium]